MLLGHPDRGALLIMSGARSRWRSLRLSVTSSARRSESDRAPVEQNVVFVEATSMLYITKRIAAVEVKPSKSNQHELNATRLRTALGFGADRVRGVLSLVFYGEDGQPPFTDDCEFTLYNSREGKPRPPEYRLYYRSEFVARHAQAGDLFALFRPRMTTNDLLGVLARAGSRAETELCDRLASDPTRILARFGFQ